MVLIVLPFFFAGKVYGNENLDYVKRSLNSKSIPFEERFLLADYGGFGSSALVRNADEPDMQLGTFVFAVPLGAKFATDTALAFAETVRSRSSRTNILVAFLGDERSRLPADMGGVSYKGLRDLLSLVDMPENWVLCYFDADEDPRELVIRHGIRGYLAPLDIVEPLPRLFNSRNIPWSFMIKYNEIYKLGLIEGSEALAIAWAEEINGFALSGKGPAAGEEARETISAENAAELLFEYAGTLDFPVLNADRHYSAFSIPGGRLVFLNEGIIAAILLAAAGLLLFVFLIYSGFYNASLLFHLRIFIARIWIFLIFLPLMVLAIKASGLLYSSLLGALGPPDLNALKGPNYMGAWLTMLLAALIFFLPSPFLHFIHFPRRARFYGFSAAIIISLGIVSAAFMDLSYVPIFLWAFFFVILGASLANPVLIFLCALLVPLFIFGALRNIVETGGGRIAELFIESVWNTPASWLAAFQFGLLSLPILLIVKRGAILIQKYRRQGLELKPNRKYRLIAIPILIAAAIIAMLVQILLIPKAAIPPERRYIADTAEPGSGAGALLRLNLQDTVFQDSRIITVNLEAKGDPVRFDISLESANGGSLPPIYSAPVPFEREDDGARIGFSLGENAPNPFSMEIVVPLRFEGHLKTVAVYNAWDPEVDPGEKPGSEDYVLSVAKIADLGRGPAGF